MKKDFDFDDIGKRTPYRTPDGFFEDVQRKVMERAGVKQQRKSHTKLIISTVITIAAVWRRDSASLNSTKIGRAHV